MKGTFSEIIRSSGEWTKTVLFKPFSLKKWIFLCIIAILAAEISGCNTNLNFNIPSDTSKKQIVQEETIKPVEKRSIRQRVIDINLPVWLILVIITGVIIGLLLLVVLMWIYSRFSFIFLSSIVRNDASIKEPFRENKFIGNSFFKWNIVLFCAFFGVAILGVCILIGSMYLFRVMPLGWRILLIVIPWSLVSLALFIAFCIITLIVRDFILPVMFKNRVGVLSGWNEIMPIIRNEKLNFLKYILLKAGLRILTAIFAGFFSAAVMVVLLIQLGIIGGLLYSVSFLLSPVLKLGYYILLIILGIICFAGIVILLNFVLLPISVYFRTFSLKFLARIDERYDLFKLAPEKEGI